MVKVRLRFLLPDNHDEGSVAPKSLPNELPDCSKKPVAGETFQMNFPSTQSPLLVTLYKIGLSLTNETLVLTQAVSLGEKLNNAIGRCDIRIPPIVPGVELQGLVILYDTVKELLPELVQLALLNACVYVGGGG